MHWLRPSEREIVWDIRSRRSEAATLIRPLRAASCQISVDQD